MEIGLIAITAVVSYFIGSLPTGFLAGKAKGLDIRTQGSGNIGATNAFRILGKKAGIFVLLVDALKGYLACWLIPILIYKLFPEPGVSREHLALAAGVAAIMGHNYTCWLRFKGGKGIATTTGVLLAMAPLAAIVIVITFILIVVVTRYVSVASIVGAALLPLAAWFLDKKDSTTILVFCGLSALAIYKHKSNIQRLLNGTEHRVGAKNKDETK